ncbi:hypothetical protein KSC_020150 [Ktedonobacter sp. SOSP1-52]|nr:hypothetical protein KSC_020150 [Ktedonobacter sp. SOSP1-52]
MTLVIRQCIQSDCPNYHKRQRPEEEGRWALPHGEFGLDIIALIGQWRFREHRSVPEMRQALQVRGVTIALRSVTHLMHRYEECVSPIRNASKPSSRSKAAWFWPSTACSRMWGHARLVDRP